MKIANIPHEFRDAEPQCCGHPATAAKSMVQSGKSRELLTLVSYSNRQPIG
jgi:hypothetical protein